MSDTKTLKKKKKDTRRRGDTGLSTHTDLMLPIKGCRFLDQRLQLPAVAKLLPQASADWSEQAMRRTVMNVSVWFQKPQIRGSCSD